MAFKNILLLATAFATIAIAAPVPDAPSAPSKPNCHSSATIINNCPNTVYLKREYANGKFEPVWALTHGTPYTENIDSEGISIGITSEDYTKKTTQPPQLTYAMTLKDNTVWTQLTDINLEQPDLKPPFDNSKYSWKMESSNPICKVPTMGKHSQPIACKEETIYTLTLCPN